MLVLAQSHFAGKTAPTVAQVIELTEQGEEHTAVAGRIEERLASFQVLLPEFVWLFCRLCGQSIEKPGEVTVQELATLMVLRAHLSKQLKMARSSNAGPNQATSA